MENCLLLGRTTCRVPGAFLELCTGEVQGMEGKAQSDPTAQPAFTNADFRFGFPALPRCRLSMKGEFSPQ